MGQYNKESVDLIVKTASTRLIKLFQLGGPLKCPI